MKANEIFMPGGIPEITYVSRNNGELESEFTTALNFQNMLISISGPSKIGKTVLCNRLIPEQNTIRIHSSEIKSARELWLLVLRRLRVATNTNYSNTGETVAGGGALPGSVSVGATVQQGYETPESDAYVELKNQNKVLIIDDFHYLSRDLQTDICRNIKHALELGVKVITICASYKHEDPARANPDLRLRYRAIDIKSWQKEELIKIAKSGFEALNITVSQNLIDKFAEESLGSPHLMQYLCLDYVYAKGIVESPRDHQVIPCNDGDATVSLKNVAKSLGMQNVILKLSMGPKGKLRKPYNFVNGRGDLYSATLKMLALSPPKLTFTYADLRTRMTQIFAEQPPQFLLISNTISQMNKLAKPNPSESSAQMYFDWDSKESILNLPDPLFLFSLRWNENTA